MSTRFTYIPIVIYSNRRTAPPETSVTLLALLHQFIKSRPSLISRSYTVPAEFFNFLSSTDVPSNMQLAKHNELIAVMTELWELLDLLATVKPGASLQRSSSDTGVHHADRFNVDAALAAGFTHEAAKVMSALPYLHDSQPDMGQRAVEICGSTFPLSYLDFDEEQFADQREIFADPDNLILPSAFRLTWQDVNGWEYIYDAEKSIIPPFCVLAPVALLTIRLNQGLCMFGIQ